MNVVVVNIFVIFVSVARGVWNTCGTVGGSYQWASISHGESNLSSLFV